MRSISFTFASAIAAALTPKHGGQFVSQLTTLPTANEPQWVFSWENGDVIELCDHGAYISQLDDPGSFLIERKLIARAGEEWPDEYVLGPSGQVEGVGTETSNRTEKLCDLQCVACSVVSSVGFLAVDVDAAFDATFGGEP